MTARDRAKALLTEDGFTPADVERWLRPEHAVTAVFVKRNMRAEQLRRSGWVETPQSERVGELIRALLAM